MYKVVKVIGGRLFSATADWMDKKLVIEYPIGKWVKAKVGKIFIFTEKRAAINFMRDFDSPCQIWRIKARGVSSSPKQLLGIAGLTFAQVKAFWKYSSDYFEDFIGFLCPRNIKVAEKIMLIERI